ncbi:hypothetical protein [Adonisia turfae]|uniref:SPOR domain-containing protein n=1 Tax=Adonisia turfae CCMR0081 TaxID=2292702 RepID=A0A6M0RVA3_9CYAN|nr:hypothetical protein [Adonisia turfae]NEZ60174.1 hypothetical protein [Adonisia turfae CCMR0081]
MGYRWLSGAMLILLSSGVQGIAQSYPDCPPPASGEYLLLVRGSDAETRDRTISVLPVDKPTLVCNYLDDTVIRAGGFTSLEVANSWALYLNDIEELETVVVESSTATQEPVVDDSATSSTTAEQEPVTGPVVAATPVADLQAQYQPTLLGEGVAVLVDYQQNPEIGRNLAQQGSVGLAVYLQQPYLLVLHTTDSSAAAARLQQLVDSGLTSFLVNGEKVIRLTDTIQ